MREINLSFKLFFLSGILIGQDIIMPLQITAYK